MPELQPLTAKLVIDVGNEGQKVEQFARDTGRRLDPILRKKLEVSVDDAFLRVRRIQAEIKKFDDITKAPRELRINLDNAKRDLTEARRRVTNFVNTGDPAMSRFRRTVEGVGGSIKGLVGRLTGITGVVGGIALGIGALGRQLNQGISDVISFESAFAGVRKTLEASEAEFEKINKELKDLTTTLPLTFEELSKIAELGGQLGVSAQDITKFTETIAKISATTNLTSEQAATDFARIANVLQIPLSRIDELASVVVELGNNFATTEAEIVTFAQRLSASGRVAGFQSEEIFAISTALSSVGVNAEAGGTALSKAFIEINSAIANGGSELDKFGAVVGKTGEEFATAFRDDAGDAFVEFVEKLQESGDGATAIIDELFGSNVRTRNAFLSLASAGDLLSEAMSSAGEEMKNLTALNDEAEKRFATTESRLIKLNSDLRNQRAELAEGLVSWRVWISRVGVDAVRAINDFSDNIKLTNDGLNGFKDGLDNLTASANTQIEAATIVSNKIKEYKDSLDEISDPLENMRKGQFNLSSQSDILTESLNNLESGLEEMSEAIEEEAVARIEDLQEQFVNGQLTGSQFATQLLTLAKEVDSLGISLSGTELISRQTNIAFQSISTAKTQGEFIALINQAAELEFQARKALAVLNGFGSINIGVGSVVGTPLLTTVRALDRFQTQIAKINKKAAATSPVGGSSSSGGGGGGKSQREKDLEEALKEEEKMLERNAKFREELSEKIRKRETKQFENLKDEARDTFEQIGEDIQDLQDEIDDLTKDIESATSNRQGDLSSRFTEVVDEINSARDELSGGDLDNEDRSLLQARLNALIEEQKLIEANTTEEERREAIRREGLSVAEKIIEDSKLQIEQLEEEKEAKLNIINELETRQVTFEEAITQKLGVEIDKRISFYDSLKAAAERAASVASTIGIGSGASSSSTTNNTSNQTTINVNSAEAAQTLVPRNLVSSIQGR